MGIAAACVLMSGGFRGAQSPGQRLLKIETDRPRIH
jgi:hypothetical protein